MTSNSMNSQDISMKFSTFKDLKTIDVKHTRSLCSDTPTHVNVGYGGYSDDIKVYDGAICHIECDEIIKNTNDVRKSSFGNRKTALVFDKKYAEKLRKTVQQCFTDEEITVTPYGLFGECSGNDIAINDLFRISEYESNDSIKMHWDAQFSTKKKRSSMSLIIYLSDGGGTNFYKVNKYGSDVESCTKTKIKTVEAVKGRMVLFNQRLLHDSIPCSDPRFILRTDVIHDWRYDNPNYWMRDMSESLNLPINHPHFLDSIKKDLIHNIIDEKTEVMRKNMHMFYKAEKYFKHAQLMDLLGEESDIYYESATILRMGIDIVDYIDDKDLSEYTPFLKGIGYSIKHISRNGTDDSYKYNGDLESCIKMAALISLASISTLCYKDVIKDIAFTHGVIVDKIFAPEERSIHVEEKATSFNYMLEEMNISVNISKKQEYCVFNHVNVKSLNVAADIISQPFECRFDDCSMNDVTHAYHNINDVFMSINKSFVKSSPLKIIINDSFVEFIHLTESFNHASCQCEYERLDLDDWNFDEKISPRRIIMKYSVNEDVITINSSGWVNL